MTALCLGLLLLQAPYAQFTIAGMVVDAVSQRPLAKVRLLAMPTTERSRQMTATSRADGHFEFTGLAAGKYTLAAQRIGYPTQRFGLRTIASRYSSAVVVNAEQRADNLVFKMIPGGVLTGRVTDRRGEPIPGMTVDAVMIEGVGKTRRAARYYPGSTDDRGIYRIPFLSEGRFAIVALGTPWQPQIPVASVEPMAYPPTFYPGVTQAESAGLVEVKPGAETRADVVVTPVVAAKVVGTIAAANAGTRKYVFLSVPSVFGMRLMLGATHWVTNGRFTVNDLPAGRYGVNLYEEGSRRTGFQFIDVAAPETAVTIGESPAAEVSVGVTVNGKAPGAGGAPMTVTFQSLTGAGTVTQAVGANGRARFTAIVADRYQATVTQGKALPVVAMNAKGAAVSGLTFTVPETGRIELDLTVDGQAADLNGKLVDAAGNALVGGLAMLVQRVGWESTGAYKFDQSDSDGTFTWGPVPAGEYMMFAFEEGDPGDCDDAAVIRELMSRAQLVTVTGEGKQVVTLRITAKK